MKQVRRLPRGRAVFITMHRRHLYFLGFVGVLVLVYVFTSLFWRSAAPVVGEQDDTPVIAIDAGHGGPDPGAVGVAGSLEKDITLAVALRLQQTLQEADLHTVMTRTADEDLVRERSVSHRQRADLVARAALVNAADVTLFVSLHANSFPSPSLSGAQTFYLDGDEVGERLALYVQHALVAEFPPNRRQAAPADLRILKDVEAPAVVVEVGFLSNSEEEALLNDPVYQGRIAQAIADGIDQFLRERRRIEGRLSPTHHIP